MPTDINADIQIDNATTNLVVDASGALRRRFRDILLNCRFRNERFLLSAGSGREGRGGALRFYNNYCFRGPATFFIRIILSAGNKKTHPRPES